MNDTTPPGAVVRFYEKHGGWRFGRVISVAGSIARLEVAGAIRRVSLDDITQWPPEQAATDDTTPRRPARRK